MHITLKHFTSVLYTPNQFQLLEVIDSRQLDDGSSVIVYGLKCESQLPLCDRTFLDVTKDSNNLDRQYTLVIPELNEPV